MAFAFGRGALISAALVATAATGVWAAPASLQPPYYSPRYKVLVMPYEGDAPSYTEHALANPPRVYLDFKARAFATARREAVVGHPLLLKWAIAPRDAETARVTLTFREAAHVEVIHNPRRHLLFLVVQPGAAERPRPAGSSTPTPRPTPTPSPKPSAASPASRTVLPALGAGRYDAADGGLVIPCLGPWPTYRTGTLSDPPRVYFDFDATGLKGFLKRAEPAAPALERWVMGPRDAETVRVTMTLRAPGRVLLRQDPARQALVLVPVLEASPAPTAAPTATPAPRTTARPAPAPRRTFAPIPTAPPSQAPLIPGPESDRPASGA